MSVYKTVLILTCCRLILADRNQRQFPKTTVLSLRLEFFFVGSSSVDVTFFVLNKPVIDVLAELMKAQSCYRVVLL